MSDAKNPAVARRELMQSAREDGAWIVVTEADGSKVAYSACETQPGYVWVQWHEWSNAGVTVEEATVARSIVKRYPDVELANEAPEQCQPTEDVIN